jgi:hypothetical protein
MGKGWLLQFSCFLSFQHSHIGAFSCVVPVNWLAEFPHQALLQKITAIK